MVYKIDTYEVCAECGKHILRDIRGEHIIFNTEEFCVCGDVE